ncbi:MAG: hypothetical protein AMXMBFR82_20200 [Candidatus Hydrogenedentota bacterium]
MTAEERRLREAATRKKHWRKWGPYLAERQWGTVREDYSADGDAWRYVTHDMARSYTYRWGEDGIAGISDNHQRLCFAIALWNGQDDILKERLYGVSNHGGNQGEDVKECYWYLDATPSHSYLKYLYRYPIDGFPYELLAGESRRRTKTQPEFELVDTGVFNDGRFYDIQIEYAKAAPEDIAIRITITNRSSASAQLTILPTLWFRNTWAWTERAFRPSLSLEDAHTVTVIHDTLGPYRFWAPDCEEIVFTENETNRQRLYQAENPTEHVKDGIHRYIVRGEEHGIARDGGTKCAARHTVDLEPGASRTLLLQLARSDANTATKQSLQRCIAKAIREADDFYDAAIPESVADDERRIARQAFAGMIWNKQFYHYVVETWLKGDPTMPPPNRNTVRNDDWKHVYTDDVLSMPDKWEYPWFAVWDSAFHAVTHALIDPAFAKRQIELFTREWYMHPNGELPAYEWNFSDANPPVHAWAAFQVYRMEREAAGKGDTRFLEAVFQKLLMNFTWWVNRKDDKGDNIFNGGFLGMDNIGVFDRSKPLPTGGVLEQSDATSWMAMYSLRMLTMAWELTGTSKAYEDTASKFFEHFLYIANAIYNIDGTGQSLWHPEDNFFYDQIRFEDGRREPIRLRSIVGLIPLLAVEIIDHGKLKTTPDFARRMNWFYEHRPDLTSSISCIFEPHESGRCCLSLLNQDRLRRILRVMLDENEFLSDYGIRSLSRHHLEHPYVFESNGYRAEVKYEPAESASSLFGGNSNWRGPIWFPVNYLIIDALKRYHAFWGPRFTVECPSGSGNEVTLEEVANELSRRMIRIFQHGDEGRPFWGQHAPLFSGPDWMDKFWFYEYFNGDTGGGLGANHQTGWTGLVANLICQMVRCRA